MEEKIGYHIHNIKKGEIGELSKIEEELAELQDALYQESKIMALVELSDLYGAIELFTEKHFNMKMEDLAKMSKITQRAFKNGHR